jgi:hypothetical protein
VVGEDLGYHWFAHAWMAHVTAVSGTDLDLVLLRVMPALMPMTVVVCVMVAGLRLSGGSAGVALLASALTMCGSGGNPFALASLSLPLVPESPTLALGVPTLLALVLLLGQRWDGELPLAAYPLVPWLAVIATGTKGATSPLVVAGLALAAGAMLLWNRRRVLMVVIDLLVVAGALVLTMVLVFQGARGGLALGIEDAADETYAFRMLGSLPTQRLVLTAVALVVLGGLTRAALAFAPLFSSRLRRDPMAWLLVGAALAGAGATGVFSHPGRSQYYFLMTAIPLAALGSALGAQAVVRALGRRRTARLIPVALVGGVLMFLVPTWLLEPVGRGEFTLFGRVVAVAAGLALLTAACGVLLGGSGHRVRAGLATVATAGLFVGVVAGLKTLTSDPFFPEVSRPTSLTRQSAVSQSQIDAARYIRDHSDADDVVMTNRHCTIVREPRDGCDSRRWVVSAFSERQSLVEGWATTPESTLRAPEGRASLTVDYWRPELLRLNDEFIAAPTEASWRRLWDLGVRWVYVDKAQAHAGTLEPYATGEFDSRDASAWRLVAPGRSG